MILKRFYEDALAQASFLLGCPTAGEAIVIDPNRDVEPYLAAAAAERLRIVAVTETHIHADYVSGARELAARTDARLFVSDCGGPEWAYAFANEPGVTRLHDADVIPIGGIRLTARHTPGHTPEHLSFVITDTAASDQPLGVLTGDFVFAGDVGRPDLLERAAGMQGTMEVGARTLFRSLQSFKRLPPHLMLWPGHGAGSACGKSLGAMPVTTLGYEAVVNHGLSAADEEAFVADILAGQPDPPPYFAEMKRINREGPRVLGGLPRPQRMEPADAVAAIERGDVFVDVRRSAEVAKSAIPGVLHVPAGSGFIGWAGWFLPYDRPVRLLAETEGDANACARALALIGIDDVPGWTLATPTIAVWSARHGAPVPLVQATAAEAAAAAVRGEGVLVDVRTTTEWRDGHARGALHAPLGHLRARAAELPRDRTLFVMCAGGSRSPIAISVLRGLGFTRLAEIPAGFGDFPRRGLAVEGAPKHAFEGTAAAKS